MHGCWILLNGFLLSKWSFLSSYIVNIVNSIDFQMLNQFFSPGITSIWSGYIILFQIYFWISCANILLKIFASLFMWDIGKYFPFFKNAFVRFGIRIMKGSENEFLPPPFSENICVRWVLYLCWVRESSGPGNFFVVRFLAMSSKFI